MGAIVSKRVKRTLSSSSEFNSACDSAFTQCLTLTQHAFPHVFPYQLATASDHLYQTLTLNHSPHPFLLFWINSPPTRSRVDSALRALTRHHQDLTLDELRFKDWAVELFAGAVISGAGKRLALRSLISVVVIAGIGTVTRMRKGFIGAAIGIYALFASSFAYWSFGA